MKNLSLISLLFVTALSSVNCAKPQANKAEIQAAPVTLRELVFVDMHSREYMTEHPLLTGEQSIYPGGREFLFWPPRTNDIIHAVCPKGTLAPTKKDLAKLITLHGRYKTITEEQRNRCWTLKKPYPHYKYFLVSAWGCDQQNANSANDAMNAIFEKMDADIARFNKEILPPKGTAKTDVEAVYGPQSHILKSGKFIIPGQPIHAYKLLPSPNKEEVRAGLLINYRDDKVWQADIGHLCVRGNKFQCFTGEPAWKSRPALFHREKQGQLKDLAAIKEKYKTKLAQAPWNKTTK